MKIGQLDNKAAAIQPVGTERPAAPKPGVTQQQLQQEASAQVELSPAATSLLSEDSADFDAEKVARIASAIREGRFQVNAEVIADKLIANAGELMGVRASH